jgi:hypothetical protein
MSSYMVSALTPFDIYAFLILCQKHFYFDKKNLLKITEENCEKL